MNPDILNNLLPIIFEKCRIDRFEVKIKSNRGITNLDVHKSDTIQSLKLKLQLLYGIFYNKQIFVHKEKVLEDTETLTTYSTDPVIQMVYPTEESTMALLFQRIHGRLLCISVEPETLITELKAKIEMEDGIPSTKQQLILKNGKVLEDCKRILDYNISGREVITLAMKFVDEDVITITVKRLMKDDVTIIISLYETIDDLRMKIEEKCWILKSFQLLRYVQRELEDGHTLSYYGLHDKCVLHLLNNLKGGGLVLKVRTIIGEIIDLDGKNTFIFKIKEYLEGVFGVLSECQRLFLFDEELDDDMMLGDYFTKLKVNLYLPVILDLIIVK